MRKVFCDGCNEELREHLTPQGFLRMPNEIHFTGIYHHNEHEIIWCRKCIRIAETAVKEARSI